MAQAEKSSERGGGIQSLERATALLEAVTDAPDGIGLADLSTRVGLHTSTAFHLVKTLVSLGFLTQEPGSKRYRIGSRLFALAAGARNDTTLLTLGIPVLERLSERTGEASHLAVRSRQDIIIIARIAAQGMLQMSERAGLIRPAHATAIGKILLAALPQEEREQVLQGLAMPRLTERTITDPDDFRAELMQAAKTGMARDDREFDPEISCLAMPVRDFSGRVVAAIGISGPVWRMTPEAVEVNSGVLAEAAAAFSGTLGFRAAISAA
jgi:DNA-binding IclR family transcriptional regulator